MSRHLPISRKDIQHSEALVAGEVLYFRVDVTHRPRLFERSSVDRVKVNSHPQLGFRAQRRHQDWSGLLFSFQIRDQKRHLYDLFYVRIKESALVRWMAPRSNVHRPLVMQKLHSHRRHIGWVGFSQPQSKIDRCLSMIWRNLSVPSGESPSYCDSRTKAPKAAS